MESPALRGRDGTSGATAFRPLFLAVVMVFLAAATGRAATYSIAGFSDTPVVTGLSLPTAFTWTPDGRMLVLEKIGRVRIVVNGVLQGTSALDISSSVDSGSEKGLLGICLDPGFAGNGFVYLYYTTRNPQNRISRFTMSGNTLDRMSEAVILDHIDATNGNHNGGNILIGPDGKLWAAPGDSGTGGAKSQDLSVGSFNGKVLRMELDGAPAAGNPFLADATKEPRIWAYGFRNPFRFTFRPSNGSLYVADVGQDSREELDVVTAGGNYGWPMAEGTLGGCAGCIPPVFEYDHTVGQTIIGGVFPGAIYPAFLRGKYVFGDFSSSWIRYLDFSAGDGLVGTLQDLASSAEGPVHFAIGPDGAIYYVAINTGKIYRINPPPASFFTVTPCRVADTRDATGPSGGPALAAGTIRSFPVSGLCQIPSSATAVAVNLAAFQPSSDGDLRVYPAGQAAPLASSINFRSGAVRAGNAIVPLGASGQISVQCDMPSGGTHFFFDVYGYFQ
jgi:glucose/arabinose dehydrogenase